MSKARLYYPYSIHSVRFAYILDDGNFIEETLNININTNKNETDNFDREIFKNINIDNTKIDCCVDYGNDKISVSCRIDCNCGFPRSFYIFKKKIQFSEDKKHLFKTYICDECNNTCVAMEIISHPYYRESDFEPKEPYRDPNAPFAAAIFGLWAGAATALTFGAAGIPLAGMAALGATTGLTPIAAGVLTLGGSGAISSYFNTLNNGSLTVSLPSLTIGEFNNRPVNEIGIPIDLRESDYQRYTTNTTKNDLINKIQNQSIDSVKEQYPRLFAKN